MPSRFTTALRGLWAVARNPWLLNHVLAGDAAAWQARALAPAGRHPGLTAAGLPVVSLLHFLENMPPAARRVAPFAFGAGGSLPTDLLLLRALCRAVPRCRYFEIGTWRGESAANAAAEAAEVFTLNLSAAELSAMGASPRYIALHGHFSRPLAQVRHLEGNSATFDYASLGGPFDVVFIDGDHAAAAVQRDTALVFRHLVHPGTVVVWHDASRQPGEPRWEVLAGIVAGLPTTAPGQLVQVSNTLCAVYLPTPAPTQPPNPLADPTPWFELQLTPHE